MTIKQIMDSIYLIPVILDHIDNPTNTTTKIIKEAKISKKQMKELDTIKSLLMYHHNMVKSDFVGDYPLLRKGLQEYWDLYLSGIFNKLDMVDESKVFLDYACGAGQVGKKYSELNPKSSVMYVDKSQSNREFNCVDFEKDPDWYVHDMLISSIDTIMLSEIIHCKTSYWQKYLIKSSYEMLVDDGKLIIIENEDYVMEYRINKIKNTDIKVITPAQIARLTEGFFRYEKHLTIQKHTTYVFKKIPGLL